MDRLFRWLDPLFGLTLLAALLAAALTVWPGVAQAAERGNGEAATEARPATGFTAVQTLGPKLVLRQGAVAAVSVQADRNLLPLLETLVEDGAHGKTLVVRWKRWQSVSPIVAPVVTVTAPRWTALVVSGAGDIVGDGLQAGPLLARVEGSGDIRLQGLVAEALTLEIKGSGDIRAAGQAPRLAAAIAGSGSVQTDGLRADVVSVAIAGSGDASVQAEKTLAVNIAGSGDVRYVGNPAVTRNVVGSGTVTRR